MKNTGPPYRRSVLGASGLVLVISFFFPYWEALLVNGNQADELQLAVYVTHCSGPLCDRMAPPEDLARLETSNVAAAGLSLVLLALATALAQRSWALLLCLPAILLPAAVCADAAGFLVSSACGAPPGCGGGLVARLGAGSYIASAAALVLASAALREVWKFGAARLHRRADPG
jgi:hypothetical protein